MGFFSFFVFFSERGGLKAFAFECMVCEAGEWKIGVERLCVELSLP